MVYLLLTGLALWMLGCGYAGYHNRFGLFAVTVAVGMGFNTVWMVVGLEARPLSPPALTAHAAALIYACAALGFGWLVGRMARRFRESRVDPQ